MNYQEGKQKCQYYNLGCFSQNVHPDEKKQKIYDCKDTRVISIHTRRLEYLMNVDERMTDTGSYL